MPGVLVPPVLSGAFRNVDADHTVPRSGYRFRIFLPGRDGENVAETSGTGLAEGVTDPDRAELGWRAYAWPTHPAAGHRSFFVDERGEIFTTTDPRYVRASGPAPDAALSAPLSPDAQALPPGSRHGRDGNRWHPVN